MNRDQSYRGSHGGHYGSEYSRQSEQFAGADHDQDDYGRSYDQMGDSGSRRDYGQSDDEGYGSSFRDRGEARERQGGLNRGQNLGESRGRYSRPQGGYSSGGYGPARSSGNEAGGFRDFTSNDFGGRDFAGPRQAYGSGAGSSDAYGGYGGTGYGAGSYGARSYGAGSYGRGSYDEARNYGSSRGYRGWDNRDNDRGFFERAGDEVASWFGDEEAARRREQDHRGRGPANYARSDERILEDACDKLTEDWGVDASNIQVTVQAGEVTLDGTVTDRRQKRRAEDVVDDLSGVKHVQNNLRVQTSSAQSAIGRTDNSSGTLA